MPDQKTPNLYEKTAGYDGQKCDVPGGLSHTSPAYESDKFRALINSPEFHQQGWSLDMAVYRIIPGLPYEHTNIELRKDGNMVTSFDLWSLDKKNGDATFYSSGERFSPVLDDCIPDNFVVKSGRELARGTLISGTGQDIIVPFAKMAEFADLAREKHLEYQKFPNAGRPGESNSNGIPVALAEHAGFNVPETVKKATDGGFFRGESAPGKDDNLHSKIWPKGKESAYTPYESDPQKLLQNPQVMDGFYKTLDKLHLGNEQKDICLESGTNACVVPTGAPFKP